MKDILAGLILGLVFGSMILTCAARKEELVQKHCSGLTGYEYVVCQASIY